VPTLTLDAEFPEQYSYEVLIFDLERDRRLVAAVEIVSPSSKDRPESRQLLLAKCFNLLRQDVCLSIIDVVTIRQFNFYTELLAPLKGRDPAWSAPVPPIYAVTCRKRKVGRQTKLDTWSHPWRSVSHCLLSRSGCPKPGTSRSTWKRAMKRRAGFCGFHEETRHQRRERTVSNPTRSPRTSRW
jgi:hypothetical protein